MVTMEQKIQEVSKLLANGVLNSTEFAKIVEILKENTHQENVSEKTLKYNEFFKKYIIPHFKSPTSAVYPAYNDEMVQQFEGFFKKYTAIETYLDSQNSFGATMRVELRIQIDKDFNYIKTLYKQGSMMAFVALD